VTGRPVRRRSPVAAEASVEELAAVIRSELERHGWLYSIGAFGGAGFPAILAVRRTRLVALLLLPTNGRVSVDEQRWLASIRRVAGCRAEVVRPENVPSVELLLAADNPEDAWRPF
jgi:hypothetical protein